MLLISQHDFSGTSSMEVISILANAVEAGHDMYDSARSVVGTESPIRTGVSMETYVVAAALANSENVIEAKNSFYPKGYWGGDDNRARVSSANTMIVIKVEYFQADRVVKHVETAVLQTISSDMLAPTSELCVLLDVEARSWAQMCNYASSRKQFSIRKGCRGAAATSFSGYMAVVEVASGPHFDSSMLRPAVPTESDLDMAGVPAFASKKIMGMMQCSPAGVIAATMYLGTDWRVIGEVASSNPACLANMDSMFLVLPSTLCTSLTSAYSAVRHTDCHGQYSRACCVAAHVPLCCLSAAGPAVLQLMCRSSCATC